MAARSNPSIQERIRQAVRRGLPGTAAPGARPPAAGAEPAPPLTARPAWGSGTGAAPSPRAGTPEQGDGLHDEVGAAVTAAARAFAAYREYPLQDRERMLASVRRALLERVEDLSRRAVEETGLGRVPHKILKNRLVISKTPGPEILAPQATSGDDGLTLTEYAPFGVIGAITPVTNPSETVINNAIGMLAGGNCVVFNAHPSARQVTAETIRLVNRAARDAGCPVNPLHACREPSIQSAQELMRHPEVRLLVVTGGPGVVRAALDSGKKVIAAGAGNPPAVVDATADIPAAARHIVAGASFDNNIICVAEKVVVVEAGVHGALVDEMAAAGCRVLTEGELRRVEETIFAEVRGPGRPAAIERRWVGRDAVRILRAARVEASGDPPLALALVGPEHPLVWTEQMLPVLPVVQAPDVREAIEMAVRFERGNRHTAMMHSRDIEMLSLMARRIDSSIFVKNGSCAAGLGAGGEGPTSFTIASPTGEGLTDARHFCRRRRCVLVGAFRIV
jgi:aldehyde dehydrogenase